MKVLFVGGPGRSGTSAVAERLRVWPEIGSFLDAELKLFSEAGGVWDLYWNFVEAYSPQRAPVAMERFEWLFRAQYENSPGSVGLKAYVSEDRWRAIVTRLKGAMFIEGTVPRRITSEEFMVLIAGMIGDIADLIEFPVEIPPEHRIFLDKTPHNLLRLKLNSRLPVEAIFLHVMRDPRIIAKSLSKMPWGPGDLRMSALWVREYVVEMQRAFDWSIENGVTVHSVFIENIANQQAEHADYLANALEIRSDYNIFYDVGLETLEQSAHAISSDEVLILNNVLRDWAVRLGYDPGRLGRRKLVDSRTLKDPTGLWAAGWINDLSRLSGFFQALVGFNRSSRKRESLKRRP
jgi:hypothetical protein